MINSLGLILNGSALQRSMPKIPGSCLDNFINGKQDIAAICIKVQKSLCVSKRMHKTLPNLHSRPLHRYDGSRTCSTLLDGANKIASMQSRLIVQQAGSFDEKELESKDDFPVYLDFNWHKFTDKTAGAK